LLFRPTQRIMTCNDPQLQLAWYLFDAVAMLKGQATQHDNAIPDKICSVQINIFCILRFVKRVYGLTYMLLLILLLCTMPVLGSFAAALPLHFPPPPVSHPNPALKNSKKTVSSRTPLTTLQKKPKPAEQLVGAYFMHHSPIPTLTTSLTSHSPRLTPASPAYHFMIILWSVQLFEKSEASTTASPNPFIFPANKKGTTLPATSDKVSSPYQKHPQTQEHNAY